MRREVIPLCTLIDQLYAGFMKVPAVLITLCLIAGLAAGGMPQLGLVDWLYEEISKGYYQQGKSLYKQHRLTEAEVCFEKSIELCPLAPLPIHYLALVNHDQGRYFDAWNNYRRCIMCDTQCASAYYNRSLVIESWGDDVGALRDSIRAVALEPNNPVFLARRGALWLCLSNPKKAIADCNLALGFDPRYAYALNIRGRAKKDLRDFQNAEADFTEAIKLEGQNQDHFSSRGSLRYRMNNFKGALQDFNMVISLAPFNSEAYFDRAETKYRMEKFDEAIEDYEAAIRLNPKYADAYAQRGYLKSRKKDYSGAESDFSTAMRLAPTDGSIRTDYAIHLCHMKKIDMAIRECSKAVGIDPKCSKAVHFRGMFLESKNQFQGAMRNYNRAIEVAPNQCPSLYRRALLKLRTGDKASAKRDWKALLKLDPSFQDDTHRLKNL